MENSEEKERIAFENELKKAKLIAEQGAQFGDSSNLPPEIESQWLDHISAFEASFQNARMTTIRALIGDPKLTTPHELADEEIAEELEKAHKLLEQNDIVLDTICEVDEREIYRFIVDELLDEQIEDLGIKGFVSHFIYEEFHPNHMYDIQHAIKDYLNTLFSGNKEFWDLSLAKEIVSFNGEILTSKEVEPVLEDFIDRNAGGRIRQLDFKENSIKDEGAFQKLYIRYENTIAGSEAPSVEGEGVFTFTFMYGFYYINGINIPGLKL